MNHFLIDFENVSSDELKQVKGIKKNDDVVLFYSNACSTYDGCHECFPSVKPYFIHGNHGSFFIRLLVALNIIYV